MNEMNAFITARATAALTPNPGESIMEIGFGNGALSRPIIDAIGEQGKFIGIEKSAILAQEASTHFLRSGMENVTIHADECFC